MFERHDGLVFDASQVLGSALSLLNARRRLICNVRFRRNGPIASLSPPSICCASEESDDEFLPSMIKFVLRESVVQMCQGSVMSTGKKPGVSSTIVSPRCCSLSRYLVQSFAT